MLSNTADFFLLEFLRQSSVIVDGNIRDEIIVADAVMSQHGNIDYSNS